MYPFESFLVILEDIDRTRDIPALLVQNLEINRDYLVSKPLRKPKWAIKDSHFAYILLWNNLRNSLMKLMSRQSLYLLAGLIFKRVIKVDLRQTDEMTPDQQTILTSCMITFSFFKIFITFEYIHQKRYSHQQFRPKPQAARNLPKRTKNAIVEVPYPLIELTLRYL